MHLVYQNIFVEIFITFAKLSCHSFYFGAFPSFPGLNQNQFINQPGPLIDCSNPEYINDNNHKIAQQQQANSKQAHMSMSACFTKFFVTNFVIKWC